MVIKACLSSENKRNANVMGTCGRVQIACVADTSRDNREVFRMPRVYRSNPLVVWGESAEPAPWPTRTGGEPSVCCT